MNVRIVIPTYNRAHCLEQAVESAFRQTHRKLEVLVVDDGSSDETRQTVSQWKHDPRFSYVRLATNVGTAQAKNVGIALGLTDAITFHDSDDVAHPDKILLQVRALSMTGDADEILDWEPLGHKPGTPLRVDVAVGSHRFVKLDGSVHHINKRISLVDDFFPTLQSPSKTEGDWVLINSGLFRRDCFARLGGYLDSVEEDREWRNRLIASGHLFHFIEEPLLTKIEMSESLTTDEDTGYRGAKRRADREEVRRRTALYRAGSWGPDAAEATRSPLDLEAVGIAEIHNAASLEVAAGVPMTEGTRHHLNRELAAWRRPSRASRQTADLPRAV